MERDAVEPGGDDRGVVLPFEVERPILREREGLGFAGALETFRQPEAGGDHRDEPFVKPRMAGVQFDGDLEPGEFRSVVRGAPADEVERVEVLADGVGCLIEILHEVALVEVHDHRVHHSRGVVLPVSLLERVGAGEDVGAVLLLVALLHRQREELAAGEVERHRDENVSLDKLSERRGVELADPAADDGAPAEKRGGGAQAPSFSTRGFPVR